MASGIDMSARMVSLAINIAVMGFILASGVLASLRSESLQHRVDEGQLRLLAERVAAGAAVPELPASVVHHALAQGFGWVMLYGAVGVCVLAGLSFFIFGARPRRPVFD
jgi:hypothetical protein